MDSIQPQIESLSSNINELESALLPIIKTALSSTTSKLPLLDKAKLYVLATYAIESILFSYLRLNGVDAKAHPVFQELTRVKEYFNKIKTAETAGVGSKNKLDKSAAGRFIKAGLSGNDKYDAERKERQEREKAGAKRKLESMSTGTLTRFDAAGQAAGEGEKIAVVRASDLSGDEEPGSVEKAGSPEKKKKSKKRKSDQGESTDVVMSGEVDDLGKVEPVPSAMTNKTNDNGMLDGSKVSLSGSQNFILNQGMYSPGRHVLGQRDVVRNDIRMEENRSAALPEQRMQVAASTKQKRMSKQADSIDIAGSGSFDGGKDFEGLADNTNREQEDPTRWTGKKATQFRNLSSLLNTYTLVEVADWERGKSIQGNLDAGTQTAIVHRRAAVLTDEERAHALLDDLDRILDREQRKVFKNVAVPQSNMRHGGLRPGDPSHGAVLGYATENGRIFRTVDDAQKVEMLESDPIELPSVALDGKRYDGVSVGEPSTSPHGQSRSKIVKTEDGAHQWPDRNNPFFKHILSTTQKPNFPRIGMHSGDCKIATWPGTPAQNTGRGQAIKINVKDVTTQKQKHNQKKQKKATPILQSVPVRDNRSAGVSSRDARRIDGKITVRMAPSPEPQLQTKKIDAMLHAPRDLAVNSEAMLADVKSRIVASITGHLENELATELNRLKSQYGWTDEDLQTLPMDKLDMAATVNKLRRATPQQPEIQEYRQSANDQSRLRSLEDIFRRVVPLEKKEAARRRGLNSDARFQIFTSIGQDMAELNRIRTEISDRAILQKLETTRDVLWTQLKQLQVCRIHLSEAMKNGNIVVDLPGKRSALQDIFLGAITLDKADKARRKAMHPDEQFLLLLKAGRDMAELINYRNNTTEIERVRQIDIARNALVKQTMILGITPRQLADALKIGTLIVVGGGAHDESIKYEENWGPKAETMDYSNDEGF